MPLNDGSIFAGFRIVRLLGSGGMGEVYLAQHPRLPRHCSVGERQCLTRPRLAGYRQHQMSRGIVQLLCGEEDQLSADPRNHAIRLSGSQLHTPSPHHPAVGVHDRAHKHLGWPITFTANLVQHRRSTFRWLTTVFGSQFSYRPRYP